MLTDTPWPWLPDRCPADQDFVDYMAWTGAEELTIFHFGPGSHHYVGMVVAGHHRNHVLAISASREEMDAYEDLVIKRPELSARYKCFFGDIYLLDKALLPELDVATLFHLCEFTDARRSAYGGVEDADLVEMLFERLAFGGALVFYTGSSAWPKAELVLRAFADQVAARNIEYSDGYGILYGFQEYKSLLVVRKGRR